MQAGAEVEIEGVVRNVGTLDSSVGRLLFVTRDSEGEWDFFARHLFQTLAAGSSVTFETTFEAPAVAGDYTYYGCLVSSHVELSCVSESLVVVSTSTLVPR